MLVSCSQLMVFKYLISPNELNSYGNQSLIAISKDWVHKMFMSNALNLIFITFINSFDSTHSHSREVISFSLYRSFHSLCVAAWLVDYWLNFKLLNLIYLLFYIMFPHINYSNTSLYVNIALFLLSSYIFGALIQESYNFCFMHEVKENRM